MTFSGEIQHVQQDNSAMGVTDAPDEQLDSNYNAQFNRTAKLTSVVHFVCDLSSVTIQFLLLCERIGNSFCVFLFAVNTILMDLEFS